MEVPRERVILQDNESISPPIIGPLYQCSRIVHVRGYLPLALIDIEIDGVIQVTGYPGGYPLPSGVQVPLPAPLVAGQAVRARQRAGGVTSPWSARETVRDHTQEYPAGPPRPVIDPVPLYKCGVRTAVSNLLPGCNVWLTADGVQVGRVDGARDYQPIDVSPAYGAGQRVIAQAELCGDLSPPSAVEITQTLPPPLPPPGVEAPAEGSTQVIFRVTNGAHFRVKRGPSTAALIDIGTYTSSGGRTFIVLTSPAASGEVFEATQWLCPGDPESPPVTVTATPCAALPAPTLRPVQAGDTSVTLLSFVPDAQIKVFVNGAKAGESSGPVIMLGAPLARGDVVHVWQIVGTCAGRTVQEVRVACVAAATAPDPAGLNLFPVGTASYDDGRVPIGLHSHVLAGTVYYPAEADGPGTPFNARLAALGPVPVVFLVHGRHGGSTSHLGYDYLQRRLAAMGICAISVDCNESDDWGGAADNILDRAEIVTRSIERFAALTAGGVPPFGGRLDLGRTGLLGHSRGGETVVLLPELLAVPGVQVRAVLALAPTNFGASSGSPRNYPAFMTILPAHDGDVARLNGQQFYDRAATDEFRSQLFVHDANHNYFNREWLNDDTHIRQCPGTAPIPPLPVLPRATHEAVLGAYACALFRHALLGHPMRDVLAGRRIPLGVPEDILEISFGPARRVVVDNFDDGNTIAVNSLGRPNTWSGGLAPDEYEFRRSAVGAFNASFFGDTMGMVAVPNEVGGFFRLELDGARDLAGREVWLRAAEVYDMLGVVPPASGFELGLETASGAISWIDSGDVGGLSLPQDRRVHDLVALCYDATKTMPKTLRFPFPCFGLAEHVVAIRLRLNRTARRPLAFDDIEIV